MRTLKGQASGRHPFPFLLALLPPAKVGLHSLQRQQLRGSTMACMTARGAPRARPAVPAEGVHVESRLRVPAREGAHRVHWGSWPRRCVERLFWGPTWGPGDYIPWICTGWEGRVWGGPSVGHRFAISVCGTSAERCPDGMAETACPDQASCQIHALVLTRMHKQWHPFPHSSPQPPGEPPALAPEHPGDAGLAHHPPPSAVTHSSQ